MRVSQSETSGPGDAHAEEDGGERFERQVGAQGAGQAREAGRVHGPRAPDHLPGSVGVRRVHGQAPVPAPARGVSEGVGETGHAGGVVQSPGHDRPQPEHVDLGHSRVRAGHKQRHHRYRDRCTGRRVAVTGHDETVHPLKRLIFI